MREVVRHVQSARKVAGLNVDDRIALSLKTNNEDLEAAIVTHKQVIVSETLADSITQADYSYEAVVKVEGAELHISLQKA